MSGWGLAGIAGARELTGGQCACALSVRRMLLVVLTVVLFLSAASAAHAVSSFYWYGENSSNCWQTGQLGSPSFGCDGVGPNYLNAAGGNEGGRAHLYYGGVQVGVDIPVSGDYCDYWDTGASGHFISSPDATNEVLFTGLQTPLPYSSYQETDGLGATCQADYQYWGQKVSTKVSGDCGSCAMHHWVSFGEQSEGRQLDKDRPWAGYFGNPSLVVSSDVNPGVLEYGGHEPVEWGYVCPVLEDTTTSFMLEYCLQEWRGPFNVTHEGKHEGGWEEETVATCSAGIGGTRHGSALDTLKTMFYPGTSWATEYTGSQNTFVLPASEGYKHMAASITASNLHNAAVADNAKCEAPPYRNHEKISTNAADYALIGVEQGIEGWNHFYRAGANTANLQLSTQYNPLPPTASTSAASNVQQFQATLNGSVNPNGVDTHYYFEYGTTTAYGSTTSSVDAGSGTNTTPASAAVTGFESGLVYHYRTVATSSTGTTYGSDQTFHLLGGRPFVIELNGQPGVYFRDPINNLFVASYATNWASYNLTAITGTQMAGDPAVIVRNTQPEVYFRDPSNNLFVAAYGTKWTSYNITAITGTHIVGNPSVVVRNGQPEVYFRDPSNNLFVATYGTKWTSYNITAITGTHIVGNPAAVVRNGQPEVYFRDPSNNLFVASYGTNWASYNVTAITGTQMAGDPAVIVRNTQPEVYFRDPSNNLFVASYGTNWASYNVTAITGTQMAGDPAVIVRNTQPEVYFRDPSNNLFVASYGTNWASYNLTAITGTQMAGDPAVIVRNTQPEVYFRDPSNNLFVASYGTNWASYNLTAITGTQIGG